MVLMGLLAVADPVAAHPSPNKELRALDERVEATPTDAELRLRRAELRVRMGHPRDALADLRVAARLLPDSPRVTLQRAQALAALGRDQAAERELDGLIATGPPLAAAFTERARLRHADGRLDLARADLDDAILIQPTPELVLERGRLDEQRERLDDAAAGYREGLERLGPAFVVQLALVDVEQRRDRPRKALEQLDAVLALDPDRADWILIRADILQQLGQPASAIVERLRALVEADAAVRRRPTPLHQVVLARVFLSLEDHTSARQVLDLALADAPKLPAALALRTQLDALSEAP